MEVSKDEVMHYRYRVIIAGSRRYADYDAFSKYVSNYLCMVCGCGYSKCNVDEHGKVLIISGKAKTGADALAIDYAKNEGYDYVCYEADWDKCGKSAGYIRNAEMGDVGTHLFAFWDLVSRGTKHMLTYSAKKLLKIFLTPIVIPNHE